MTTAHTKQQKKAPECHHSRSGSSTENRLLSKKRINDEMIITKNASGHVHILQPGKAQKGDQTMCHHGFNLMTLNIK